MRQRNEDEEEKEKIREVVAHILLIGDSLDVTNHVFFNGILNAMAMMLPDSFDEEDLRYITKECYAVFKDVWDQKQKLRNEHL